MNRVDFAWAAGFFDGEGSIWLMKTGYYGYRKPVLAVSQTTIEPLQELQRIFGGRIVGPYNRPHDSGVVTVYWRWEVKNQRLVQSVIRSIYPYIRHPSRRVKLRLGYAISMTYVGVGAKGLRGDRKIKRRIELTDRFQSL